MLFKVKNLESQVSEVYFKISNPIILKIQIQCCLFAPPGCIQFIAPMIRRIKIKFLSQNRNDFLFGFSYEIFIFFRHMELAMFEMNSLKSKILSCSHFYVLMLWFPECPLLSIENYQTVLVCGRSFQKNHHSGRRILDVGIIGNYRKNHSFVS